MKQFFIHLLKPLAYFLAGLMDRLRRYYDNESVREMLAATQSCGADVMALGRLYISQPGTVVIGNNVTIGHNAYFVTQGGLVIGDNTQIGRNVTIRTVAYNHAGEALPFDHNPHLKPVLIGRNVWIEDNVSIAPGVRIGDGAVIRMGVSINQDVPPLSIVASTSAHIIDCRDQTHYEALEQTRQVGGFRGVRIAEETLAHYDHSRQAQLLFVLTTGRSGGTTIANVVSQHPQITSLNERRPQLIRLSAQHAHGLADHSAIREELRSIYSTSVFSSPFHCESDQKLWNLGPFLSDIFPKCKFIWLLRAGHNVAAEGLRRGWYDGDSGHPYKQRWDFFRLDGAKANAIPPDKWDSMSRAAKNCWYWWYVNDSIEAFLKTIPGDRHITVRLEALDERVDDIFAFLGVSPFAAQIPHFNPKLPQLRDALVDLLKDSEAFERWIVPGMARWYPDHADWQSRF
jgi:acetyltransferase-like isoleucine patch superfamily enzyme